MAESRCHNAVADKEQLEVRVGELVRDKKANEKKLAQQQTRLTKLTAELSEEKEVKGSCTCGCDYIVGPVRR